MGGFRQGWAWPGPPQFFSRSKPGRGWPGGCLSDYAECERGHWRRAEDMANMTRVMTAGPRRSRTAGLAVDRPCKRWSVATRGGRWPWGEHDGLAGRGKGTGARGASGGMPLEQLRRFAGIVSANGGVLPLGAGDESGGIAAVEGDMADQLVPRCWLHQAGDDAEIEADIEEDGADRTAADPWRRWRR
jgi:hypothetical protein